MSSETPVCLTRSGQPHATTSLSEINDAITRFGARLWSLSLADAPDDVRDLLSLDSLSRQDSEAIQSQFLLPRERLLEIIEQAGRVPRVPGGGSMTTHVVSHDYNYPQLYVADPQIDYTRFDRFHINTAVDGQGVDEILQILSGTGIETHLLDDDGTVFTLWIDCPSPDQGWLLTYDGAKPHITSLTHASPGTKVLVQVIGTPQWSFNYVDDAPAKPAG